MHLENKGEEEAVLNMTGLMEVTDGSRVMNPTQGGRSSDLVKEYMGQLSCRTLRRLHERYWPDFLLFQYEVGEVLGWGEGGKGCK